MRKYSVTWPARPCGVYTVLVRATNPTDAVRVAAEMELLTTPGYALAFDYEPQVWRVLRPYWLRSRPVAGPDYPDTVPGEVAFAPEPLDLDAIADRVASAIRLGDALGHSKGEIRAAIGQIVELLTLDEVVEVLARETAETEEADEFGEAPSEGVAAATGLPMKAEYYLGWAALSVNRMAEMERDGIKPTADNVKTHRLYIDIAHKAGVTDEQIREFAQVKLGGRSS